MESRESKAMTKSVENVTFFLSLKKLLQFFFHIHLKTLEAPFELHQLSLKLHFTRPAAKMDLKS